MARVIASPDASDTRRDRRPLCLSPGDPVLVIGAARPGPCGDRHPGGRCRPNAGRRATDRGGRAGDGAFRRTHAHGRRAGAPDDTGRGSSRQSGSK